MTSDSTTIDGDAAIRLRGVSKRYGALTAVDGVDLAVPRGQLLGLIGHNGAGKSTLFKMMLGLIRPSAGQILVNGSDVGGRDFRAARRSIGYLPENLVLYDNLTALETLQFFAKLKGAPAAQCAPLLEQVGLAGAAQRAVREFSKGMRQRLGFAQALLGAPRVLFLDEPTTGLDPSAIREFYAVLNGLRAQGVTLVITSHILAELQERVDRLAIMANGRVQAQGSVSELREQLQLPLQVSLAAAPAEHPALREGLRPLGSLQFREAEGRLSFSCPRPAKMALLGALAPLAARLQDVQIHEPTLEDMFFGLREAP
ncbi:ABC transporter ATP-binding protein [Paucibacter sediminis]|uniref:ABC transporter ATP-binding protein n=1 Tax=Paucibacter sediminis TaxID=3019553 RepID=A0AA95SMB1_9BURK|nr:ABC transporter ATP-binding protein [Paucibacter sp. S2-9]WIT13103.1 ABC transporter ATP-binding protein [Paucibacter sp. S2-9]